MKKAKNILIFVSGNGSNMSNLISHFDSRSDVSIEAVFSNKEKCLAVENAQKAGVNTVSFNKEELENGRVEELASLLNPDLIVLAGFLSFNKEELENGRVEELASLLNPDLIVLAGFLLKIPKSLTVTFQNKIINVHPALLPKFGGKGMYGKHVHKAVIEAGESKSGITFHYVNEHYDEGNIIAQFDCLVSPTDSWEDLQAKIQKLEREHFTEVIDQLLAE